MKSYITKTKYSVYAYWHTYIFYKYATNVHAGMFTLYIIYALFLVKQIAKGSEVMML